jgi:GT2 family glycosyltransferase
MGLIFANLLRPIHRLLGQGRHRRVIKRHLERVTRLAEQITGEEGPKLGSASSDVPFLSFVVPVFNTNTDFLDDLLQSFLQQKGPRCQLVLSDDASTSLKTLSWLDTKAGHPDISVVRNKSNRGIAAATNAGISVASGKWVGLLDHDDALAPYAAARIAKALSQVPNSLFLYTDEIIADSSLRPLDCFFKPAWDPVLLSGVNYINHLSVYRKDRLQELGGLRDGYNGSQDYELVLRYTRDLRDDEIVHLPYPAYLWRRHRKSYSTRFLGSATENARKALRERYSQQGRPVPVEPAQATDLHRIRFDTFCKDWPLVSVVIPSKDALPLITRVLDGLQTKTDYPALEVIVSDNGTTDPRVLALYNQYQRGSLPFQLSIRPEPFNFSRLVNLGISAARGDYILVLNNDTEILEAGWLKEMVSCFEYDRVGIVGAKLLYPDHTLQHAGVIVGLGDLAGHWYVGMPEDFSGPFGRLHVRQTLSAVTAACMLISRKCLDNVGGFDETRFPIAYNDIDFCLRAVGAGYRVIWTPFAKLVHQESASRGSDVTPENIARFRRDQASLQHRHRTQEFSDRAFSPWLSRDSAYPRPIALTQLPPPR